MTDIIPGTGAVVVMRVGTVRKRPSWDLPVPAAARNQGQNHVLIVSGGMSGDGRSAYVNLLATTLKAVGYRFALIELATSLGSAGRAHKADGATVELVRPIDAGWAIRLIDRVEAYDDHVVILSVQSDLWVDFARNEAALLRSFGKFRPVAYLFVDPTGSAKRLKAHLTWLSQNGLPAFEHRLILRDSPHDRPTPPVTTLYHNHITMPFFEAQIADAIFSRGRSDGQPREHATFHAAWVASGTGTKAVTFEPVARAMRDVAELLDAATYHLDKETR